MFDTQLETLARARASAEEADHVLERLVRNLNQFRDSKGNRPDGPIDGRDFTAMEALFQGLKAIRAFRALRLGRTKAVPRTQFNNLCAQIENISTLVRQVDSQVEEVLSGSTSLRLVSGASLVDPRTGEVRISLTDQLSRLVELADQVMIDFSTLASMTRQPRTDSIDADLVTDDIKAARLALSKVEASAAESRRLSEASEAVFAELSERKSSADTLLSAVSLAAREMEERLSAANSNAAVVQSRADDVARTIPQMDELRAKLLSYAETLATTQKSVASREDRAESALEKANKAAIKIAQLTADAEHMLSGATVAGLAAAFGEERDRLDQSMSRSFKWFIAGIVLLTLATVVLAAYVLNIPLYIPIADIDLTHPRGGSVRELTIAGVLSRTIILLGPFWLTLFSARRYKNLFDLRQQYSHKYNMAFSMEGFKKQSKSNADAIAAWVFSIVAQNPVQQKPSRPMDESPATSIKEMGKDVVDQIKGILKGDDK